MPAENKPFAGSVFLKTTGAANLETHQ